MIFDLPFTFFTVMISPVSLSMVITEVSVSPVLRFFALGMMKIQPPHLVSFLWIDNCNESRSAQSGGQPQKNTTGS